VLALPAKIAVTNQKGGVAKTTLSINIAGATGAAGYETLLIDLDPQGYLTNGVGLEAEYTAESIKRAHNHVVSVFEYEEDYDQIPV